MSVAPQRDGAALVRAHLAGDGTAFTTLVNRFHPRLVSFVDRMIGDRDRAEDLVQEAFLRVYRHIHRFDQSRRFSTWLYTIASNLARNELRNRRRSPVLYRRLDAPVPDDWTGPGEPEDPRWRPDAVFWQRHLRQSVEAAVTRLAPHHRQVFVLRELEGRSYEEIATLTGCNLGTVKSRLNRARQQFADLIEPAVA